MGSIRPDDATEGGWLDDVDADIVSMRFVSGEGVPERYRAATQGDPMGIMVHLNVVDESWGGDQEQEQYYNASDTSRLVPNADGTDFDTAPGSRAKAVLNKNSNAFRWIASLIEGGFPDDRLDQGVTCFDGCRVHLVSETIPGFGPDAKDRSILLVDSVEVLPEDNKDFKKSSTTSKGSKRGTGGAAKAQAKAKEESTKTDSKVNGADNEDLVGITSEVLGSIMVANDFKVKLGSLPKSAFDTIRVDEETKALLEDAGLGPKDVVRLINNKDFLASQQDYVVDGDELVGA